MRKTYYIFLLLCIVSCRVRSMACLYGETLFVTTDTYGKTEKYTTNYQIEFKKAVPQTIYVMNGFVDSKREDLFLKNSRVKKIKLTNIKTGSWKVVGLYGDGAALSQIDVRSLAFTEEANILEIEMLEVYSGTKYNDLCIQAIIPCFTDTVMCAPCFISESLS